MNGVPEWLADSWLVHDKWIVPLATICGAVGALAAAAIAGFIGVKASQVSRAQRDVAGLSEVNKLLAKLETPRWQKIKYQVAIDYLTGRVDVLYAGEVLNLIEDLALYVDRDLLSIDIIESLVAYDIICWWYALHPVVLRERARMQDFTLWWGGERLVEQLHASSRSQGIMAWSGRPSDGLMRELFLDTLTSQSRRQKEGIE